MGTNMLLWFGLFAIVFFILMFAACIIHLRRALNSVERHLEVHDTNIDEMHERARLLKEVVQGDDNTFSYTQSIKNINDANARWDKERERIIETFVEVTGHSPDVSVDLEYRVLKNRAHHIKNFEALKVWLIHFINMTEKPNDT